MKMVLVLLGCVACAPVLAVEMEQYTRKGGAICSLPGTEFRFRFNGFGGAELTGLRSNYEPIRKAGTVKTWAVNVVKEKQMLVIDNLRGTRLMVRLNDGHGMAFETQSGGVSDVICQIVPEGK